MEGDIFIQINKSQILNNRMKKEVIMYYGKMSEKQKDIIQSLLRQEKKIISDFLKGLILKDKIDFHEIKNCITTLKAKNILLKEFSEKQEEIKDCNNLLESLENI